jgi:hypothetical protein
VNAITAREMTVIKFTLNCFVGKPRFSSRVKPSVYGTVQILSPSLDRGVSLWFRLERQLISFDPRLDLRSNDRRRLPKTASGGQSYVFCRSY